LVLATQERGKVTGHTNEVETARLRLRRWRDDDLETIARWNADPFVMRHMGRPPMSREESEEALARYLRHWDGHGFGIWAAELRETGELVGRIGLSYHRAWPDDPELGWLIDPAHTGQGLATEGGAACVDYGFERLRAPRLVSICIEENVESRRVMEKLGFRLHATVPFEPLGIDLLVHARDAK
jgi:RimJ/RimL family protein N-acetyltransferase